MSNLSQIIDQQFSGKDQSSSRGELLHLQVPRTNDKKELAAEQMFAALHGLLILPRTSILKPAERLKVSFEIAIKDQRIGFYVWVPIQVKDYVKEQIYAQYPSVQISEVDDLADDLTSSNHVLLTEMALSAAAPLPIKTFQSFEVDPLASITATLAKFEPGEQAWIQLVLQPAPDNWYKRSEKYINSLKSGTKAAGTNLLKAAWGTPNDSHHNPTVRLSESVQAMADAAEQKSYKLAYVATLRVAYKGTGSDVQAKMRVQSIAASFKQFNTTYLNGFKLGKINKRRENINNFVKRKLARLPILLNIEEVATLYHLPHTSVETPTINWASTQTAEPPANLPLSSEGLGHDVSQIAITDFRGHNEPFGLLREDRDRHLYILGQTGVGKSALLELLTIADINSPYGFAIIDPHGDYALSILSRVTPERVKDVVYFNPADVDFPIAFNPMEVYDPRLKTHTVSELVGVLRRMFDSWGPRLEYILRYTLLALSDYPESTMLDIPRMLTDKSFRKDVLSYVSDPVVKNFWTVEFNTWNDRFAAEAVAPVLNKVGAFTANPVIRNIIGQPKSSFNIRQIMDERKILIVNLSRGLVGEDNAALLGALLVTKIQLAALSRADIPASERIPFYLYVDEFQNFATESFATILSEARKYGLNLTVANQYIAQMSPEVKDAVFGNVGSMVAFRMGADDARAMQKYFEPKFTEYDLVQLHNRHFVINMAIRGEKSPAFSGVTASLPPYAEKQYNMQEYSQMQYAVPKYFVEEAIEARYGSKSKKRQLSDNAAGLSQDKDLSTHSLGKFILRYGWKQSQMSITGPKKRKRTRSRTRRRHNKEVVIYEKSK